MYSGGCDGFNLCEFCICDQEPVFAEHALWSFSINVHGDADLVSSFISVDIIPESN